MALVRVEWKRPGSFALLDEKDLETICPFTKDKKWHRFVEKSEKGKNKGEGKDGPNGVNEAKSNAAMDSKGADSNGIYGGRTAVQKDAGYSGRKT